LDKQFFESADPVSRVPARIEQTGGAARRLTNPYNIPGRDGANITSTQNSITAATSRTLIALTEAPNYNLYDWATRTYEQSAISPIKKMIHTAYHPPHVWKSIIFQMLSAMYVLVQEGIGFLNFSIEDNVYIKDLKVRDQTAGHWLYRVGGINYYVPNYGYLVMIDSNFKDITGQNYTLKGKKETLYKYYSRDFSKNWSCEFDPEFQKLCLKNLRQVIDPGNFGYNFTSDGGMRPPDEIVSMLNQMYQDVSAMGEKEQVNDIICELLFRYMRDLMHNRIGTYLQEDELKHVIQNGNKNFVRGELVAFSVHDNTYVWALFVGTGTDGLMVLIRDEFNKGDIVEKKVELHNCYKYKPTEEIKQLYKPQIKLEKENRLETYLVS